MVTVEVDEEDDLNWAFIDNLLLTDPDPLYPDPMDEDIPSFTADEIVDSYAWFEANPGALNFDEDIYDV